MIKSKIIRSYKEFRKRIILRKRRKTVCAFMKIVGTENTCALHISDCYLCLFKVPRVPDIKEHEKYIHLASQLRVAKFMFWISGISVLVAVLTTSIPTILHAVKVNFGRKDISVTSVISKTMGTISDSVIDHDTSKFCQLVNVNYLVKSLNTSISMYNQKSSQISNNRSSLVNKDTLLSRVSSIDYNSSIVDPYDLTSVLLRSLNPINKITISGSSGNTTYISYTCLLDYHFITISYPVILEFDKNQDRFTLKGWQNSHEYLRIIDSNNALY